MFVQLKPWSEREGAALEARGILRTLNQAFARQVPEAVAFAFGPPAIPGLGNSGGFSMWLQDRSGGSVEFLQQNVQAFLEAARKRPELASVNSLFTAGVPQVYADVDRDKALKQGIAVGDVYQTLQTYLGGLFVNQFNRFGRQWRVFLLLPRSLVGGSLLIASYQTRFAVCSSYPRDVVRDVARPHPATSRSRGVG
jgi:hydrophobic/amphiphilic exporter-1 (mainly G- bacteria), HAE1 family